MKTINFILSLCVLLFSSALIAETKQKPLYWVAPMDPSYKRDKPGKSPMGMDLVPVYKDSADGNTIKINPTVQQNIGVRTTVVEMGDLPRIINTFGYVQTDENNIEHIHSYEKGWVRKLYVKETGAKVEKGQVLMAIYSPELVYAQQELVIALKRGNKKEDLGNYTDNIDYIESAKTKLEALGISKKQIQRIVKNQKAETLIDVEATISGVVSELKTREGMFVSPNQNLMTIEDLTKVWVIADIYATQSHWLSVGNPAQATFDDLPNQTFDGKVQFIYPKVDPITRTAQARLVFNNEHGELKPNMLADVMIEAEPVQHVLSIPREALIPSGDMDRVILSLGNGKFIAQEVKIGIESNGKYEVKKGLKPGDKVVTSAQFLLDSESSISADVRRISEREPAKSEHSAHSMHHHGGHSQ